MPPTLRYEPHLIDLLARAAVADHRVGRADPALRAQLASSARRQRARASVRLDGSPLEDATADVVDAGAAPAAPPAAPGGPASGSQLAQDPAGEAATDGWAGALRLEGLPTQELAALEYRNALAADALVDELAGVLLGDPQAALGALHAAVCRDLVDPAVVGRLRRTSQAVHDGAQGSMLYIAPEPEILPERFADLLGWLRNGSALMPALLAAATAEVRLLELSPFEAGNGRTARLLGRAVAVARGFDRHGLAVPEQAALADALAYHREIAATVRRRGDVTRWAELHAERVVLSLEIAADALDPSRPDAATDADADAPDLVVRDGDTLVDLARRTGVTVAQARVLLDSLLAGGVVRQAPGTHGLRFLRR